ncbi:hypothetical protein [Okeania sp.]|uniref:hypothetical protein n=1 Tax=Okeania sp. TaxID=3100323 RepID=UPI002B4B0609|nr:hypothetical protein [Okeania sp.]MEB3342462.1 hypothetical protein [Okeania sp.]
MDKFNMDQKDIRNRAAKRFLDNFDKQLNLVLQENQTNNYNSKFTNSHKKSKEHQFNLSDLEAAIADIDDYIQTNNKHQS